MQAPSRPLPASARIHPLTAPKRPTNRRSANSTFEQSDAEIQEWPIDLDQRVDGKTAIQDHVATASADGIEADVRIGGSLNECRLQRNGLVLDLRNDQLRQRHGRLHDLSVLHGRDLLDLLALHG